MSKLEKLNKIQELYNSFVDNAVGAVYNFRSENMFVWTTDASLYYDFLNLEKAKALSLYETTGCVTDIDEMMVKLKRNEFVQNKETLDEKWKNALLCMQEPFIGDGKILGGAQTLILLTKETEVNQCFKILIADHALEVGADLNKEYEDIEIPYLMFTLLKNYENVELENQGIIDTAPQLQNANKTLLENKKDNNDSQELK